MKILLLSPNIKGIKDGINRIQPPLGLTYLVSHLKDDYEVFVRDTAIEGWDTHTQINNKVISIGESEESITSYISKTNPDVVGISVLFSNLMDSAHDIANITKKINPNIIVTIGGNHITNVIRDYKGGFDCLKTIINKNIDYYFSGESEKTFKTFVDNIKNKTNPLNDGVGYFQDGTFCFKDNHSFFDISNLPLPSWEYFNMEKYFSVGLFHSAQSYSNRVLPVMASRGCPEKCQFCTTPLTWGAKVRWRNTDNIYDEIKKYKSLYNIGEIQFQDDTLTANQKKLYELCDYLKEFNLPWCTPNGIKINYHIQNQSEMFSKMKDSGCYQVTFACESGVQRVLDNVIRKNIKVSQFQSSIKKAKDAGLFVHSFWIVGFPGETFDEMNETIKIAADSGSDSFSLSILNPLHGTPIYHNVIKNNLWWDDNTKTENVLLRNSLIKVDGFSSADEFENWVDEKNIYLNSILEQSDKTRYINVTANRGVMLKSGMKKIKQT